MQAKLSDGMMHGWQPADTAPKDGTWILGLNNRGNFAVCIWKEGTPGAAGGYQYSGWVHPFTELRPSPFWNGSCGSVMTHWQRLVWPPELCASQFMHLAMMIVRAGEENPDAS